MNVIKKIDYSREFEKQLAKVPLSIKKAFRKRLALFLLEQTHPQLRNHELAGKLSGQRSINITGDWRAIFIQQEDQEGKLTVKFKMLGTHSQLYK